MNGKKFIWGSVATVVGMVVLLAIGASFIFMQLVSQLPAERPDQFSLVIHEGGGMVDESSSYDLQNGHMTYTKEVESTETTAGFDLTDEELDYIWQILRVERFDRIHAQDGGQVYDRGGTTVQLSYDDQTIVVSDSGSSFVRGDDAKRLYAIEAAVVEIAQPFIEDPTE